MRNLLFKCPRTGLNVQHWIAEPAANEPQCTYVSVVCPACTRLHFINRSTGKTLGLLCQEGPPIPASAENESWATAGGKDCVLHRVLLVGSLRLDGRRRRTGEGEMTMMLENRAPRIFLGIFLAIFVAPALAHDPSHSELNGWFDKLASGRGLCCSLTDGVTVADPDWESRDGHYRVRLYGEWINVPDDALITEPNRFGGTMVWPMVFNGEISVRCFMPGSMT